MTDALITFLISIIFTLGAGYWCIRLAKRFNLIDQPRIVMHKRHERPTPLAGGMTIMLALILVLIVRHEWLDGQYIGLFAAAAIVFLFGIWDDAIRLPFWAKLIGQLVACIVLQTSGISVQLIRTPGLEWLNWGITFFWVIGIINGCNFVDSYDHLLLGIILIMLAGLLVGTYAAGQWGLVQLIVTLLGICLVLYFFNASPAMTFLGDSGAQLLGFFVAAIGILFSPSAIDSSVAWTMPILIAGIPIFDTTLVVLSRLRRRKHVYQAGLDHTWHRLVALGLKPNQAVQLIHLGSILLCGVALLVAEMPRIITLAGFAVVLFVGFCLILFLDSRKRWE